MFKKVPLFIFVSIFIFPSISFSKNKKEIPVATTASENFIFSKEPRVRVKVGRRGVQSYPIEQYLVGVIGREMSRHWDVEALKAQAVAARSYALARMIDMKKENPKSRYDLQSTQADQVFNGRDLRNKKLREVVASTRGEVLFHHGEIIEAYYSSSCGGKTRLARDAGLKGVFPVQKTITDPYCQKAPFRHWKVSAALMDIEKRLNKADVPIRGLKKIRISKRDRSGFVKEVKLSGLNQNWTITGDKLRWAVGSRQVKSTNFGLVLKNGVATFIGCGYGHGVGMCQYGVKGMVGKGKTYREALAKYYPDMEIVKVYK